jgi:hypothetical protein
MQTLAALVAVGGMEACTERDEALTAGGLTVHLTDAVAATRALPAELEKPLESAFRLSVDGLDDRYTRSFRIADCPVTLNEGRYTLSATCGENALLAWDAPYYTGDSVIAIQANTDREVYLTCRVSNALASFTLTNPTQLNQFVEDYYIRLTASYQGKTAQLDWHPSMTESPYFPAGAEVTCTLIGSLVGGGDYAYEFTTGIAQAQAGKHYRFTLTVENMNGTATEPTFVVDRQVEEVTVAETVPESYLPAPHLSATTESEDIPMFEFNASNLLEYVETAEADVRLNYSAARDVTQLSLTFNFSDTSLSALNQTFDLLALTAEQDTLLHHSGITFTPADDARSGQVDLSTFVSNLESDAQGNAQSGSVTLAVTANGRQTSQTYRIRTIAPAFTLAVDERQVWSKTFTADDITVTRGNAARLVPSLTYQYKAQDAEVWTAIPDNGNTVHWDTQPTQRNYSVQALFKSGKVLSNICTLELEEEAQIPNSGFEEWTDETYYSNRYYCFYPWNEESKGNCHWDTNNVFTTRHRYNSNTQAHYNGFHCVSYVPGADGTGLAAELRNTANGRGNTKFLSSHTDQTYNRVAGEIYTGTAKLTTGGSDVSPSDKYEIIKDAAFPSRPTAVAFKYKYAPYGTDTWIVNFMLLDAEGQTICEASQTSSAAQADWTDGRIELPLVANALYSKCSYIFVQFRSTINDGANMPYNNSTSNSYTFYINGGTGTISFDNAYVGSILTIDDVKLIYDK